MGYAVLTEARLVAETSTALLAGAHLVAGVPTQAVLTRASMTTAGSITVSTGPDLTTDPFEWVVLAASIGGTPDSVLWELLSSSNSYAAPAPIDPSAPATGYWAPPTVNGAVLTWRCTATMGGVSVSDTVVHTVRNHAGPWIVTGANYNTGPGRVGVKITAVDN